jgi:hypothetical protein
MALCPCFILGHTKAFLVYFEHSKDVFKAENPDPLLMLLKR